MAASVLGASAVARADDTLALGAAVGAGGQGDAVYSAAELRMDATWNGARIGLGVRGVWLDGEFRDSDWSRVADAVNVLRYLEASTTFDGGDGSAAIAAGGLAPAHIAQLADGYRAQLDDLLHTGARIAVSDGRLEVGAEIDDVLDPALIGGSARVAFAGAWGIDAAAVFDPNAPAADAMPTTTGAEMPTRVASALELGFDRRFVAPDSRASLGGAIVAEPGLGASIVAFGDTALDRGGIRFTAARRSPAPAPAPSAPRLVRSIASSGSPHAGELGLDDRARMGELDGVGAGLSLGAALPAGWLQIGMRARPGLAALATIYAGAPMGKWLQAGLWAAASRDDSAGAAELRVTWSRRLFSALDLARLYRLDPADPLAVWSAVAWFGATSD